MKYPEEVTAFLFEFVPGHSNREVVAELSSRFGFVKTEAQIKSWKSNNHVKSGTIKGREAGGPTDLFPADVCEYIMQNYKGVGPKEMAERLTSLGHPYNRLQIKGFYGNHKLSSGLTGHWEKGHGRTNDYNVWEHPNSIRTRFKPGCKVANTAEIGALVVTREGYFKRKIAEKEWIFEHRRIWEEANGPVPDGCLVSFLDGNPKNCKLENLILLTRAEHGIMNKTGLRSSDPELTATGALVAKLQHQLSIRAAGSRNAEKEAENVEHV